MVYVFLTWMEVTQMVLMMSATVQPRLRSFTGFTRPCMTGPIATAPVACWTALYVLLPDGVVNKRGEGEGRGSTLWTGAGRCLGL